MRRETGGEKEGRRERRKRKEKEEERETKKSGLYSKELVGWRVQGWGWVCQVGAERCYLAYPS